MIAIDKKELKEVTGGTGTVLFVRAGDRRCDAVQKTLKNTAIKYFDISKEYDIAFKLNISEVPILIKYRNGKEINWLKGINGLPAYLNIHNDKE